MGSLLACRRGSAFGRPVGRGIETNTGFAYKAAKVKCKCIPAKPNHAKEKRQPGSGQYLRHGALFPIDAFFARPCVHVRIAIRRHIHHGIYGRGRTTLRAHNPQLRLLPPQCFKQRRYVFVGSKSATYVVRTCQVNVALL